MEKLGKSSNNKPQKQPAKQAKKGKDIEIIEIEVDSNLFIHFWSKQVFAC